MRELYLAHKTKFEIAYWVINSLIAIALNTSTVILEHERNNQPIATWEPLLWESSSQAAILLLIPIIVLLNQRFNLNHQQWKQRLLLHAAFAVLFSIIHIAIMVGIRKVGYELVDSYYDFGNLFHEFIYELRKDVLDYINIIVVISVYQFISSRLIGEAKAISEDESVQESKLVNKVLVRKLGKEFIVDIANIEWIEAAGNYMNLHVNQNIYPLRSTMVNLCAKLDESKFLRIHRSYIANIDLIDQIEISDSGDGTVTLKNGKTLPLSRRYKQNFDLFNLS